MSNQARLFVLVLLAFLPMIGLYWYASTALESAQLAAGLGMHIGPATRQLDLQGRMAMPGINDVHSHPWQGGTKVLYGCNFAFSATPAEIADIISECVARDPDAQWITGGQWTSDFFKNHDLGSPREWLDRISGDKALYLEDAMKKLG